MSVRTDLAVERLESGELTSDNLEHRRYSSEGMDCVRVRQPDGGTYLTLSLDELLRREQESFARACRAVASQLRELAPDLSAQAPVLVIGLGNRAVTPDAIGPLCCQSVLATRHLTRTEPILDGFRTAPLDRAAAAALLRRLAELMQALPQLAEIDLNPCRVYARGCAILDARIVVKP